MLAQCQVLAHLDLRNNPHADVKGCEGGEGTSGMRRQHAWQRPEHKPNRSTMEERKAPRRWLKS